MYHWDQLAQMGALTREQQAVTSRGAYTPIDAPAGTVVVPTDSMRRKGTPIMPLLVAAAVAYGAWQVFGKKLFGKRRR